MLKKAKLAHLVFMEDNIADIEYIKYLLKKNKILFNLHFCRDGAESLDFLYRRGTFAKAAKPDLLFLDLNLPKVDGKQILKIVKEDPTLNSIPIVILSGSNFEEDIVEAYKQGAKFYMKKPFKVSLLLRIIKDIDNLGIQIVDDYLHIVKVNS